MGDATQMTAPRSLMNDMGLSNQNIERRQKIVGLDADDLARIKAMQDLVARNADDFVKVFFSYLAGLDEARPLTSNRALTDQVQRLKRQHLIAMVEGEYGPTYVIARSRDDRHLGDVDSGVSTSMKEAFGRFSVIASNL